MKPCRGSLLLSIAVLVIVFCVSVQAATKALSKSECKQIQQTPSFTDNIAEELIKGVSGKIIEYYNWFFRPKSLTGGESRTFGRPIRKLKNALIPIMFWMGIVFSMIKFIMFLSMKSVAIGLAILTLNVAFIASKIALFFKGGHGGGHGGWAGGSGGGKDVHVHVHPTQGYGKPAGGWEDRNYQKSYYVTEDGQNIPYAAYAPALAAIAKEKASEDQVIKKRSAATILDDEIIYEYELPHQMGVVPPTPNALEMEKIKSRRSLIISN